MDGLGGTTQSDSCNNITAPMTGSGYRATPGTIVLGLAVEQGYLSSLV